MKKLHGSKSADRDPREIYIEKFMKNEKENIVVKNGNNTSFLKNWKEIEINKDEHVKMLMKGNQTMAAVALGMIA